MSQGYAELLERQIKLNSDIVSELEGFYSPENINAPEKFDMGKVIERFAENQAKREEINQTIMMLTGISTNLLVGSEKNSNGIGTKFAITEAERIELIKLLEDTFGEKISKGIREQKDYLSLAGASIYEVLSQDRETAN